MSYRNCVDSATYSPTSFATAPESSAAAQRAAASFQSLAMPIATSEACDVRQSGATA